MNARPSSTYTPQSAREPVQVNDTPSDSEIVSLLKAINLKLDTLPRDIALAAHRGGSLSREDRRTLETVVPAVSRAIGNAAFTTRDLIDQGLLDEDLNKVLVEAFGPLSAASRKIGKLLARSNGIKVDGYQIDRVASVREGALWQVTR